jgi:hypothetical protein
MKPERPGLVAFVLVVVLLLSCSSCSLSAAIKCGMCARECSVRTITTVNLSDGKSLDYCCPHCAAMALGMLDLSQRAVSSISLSDYNTRERIDSEKAACVMESDVVPCCAPSVLAFSSDGAAAKFQKAHGGTLCSWRTVAEKLTAAKCAVCPMSVYPPTAYMVRAGRKRGYGCCPVCALAAALKAGGSATIVHWTTNPRRRVEIRLEDGRIVSYKPSTLTVWMITPPEDQKPNCHSWMVFADAQALSAWRERHPEAAGQVVTLDNLLPRAQMKLRQAQGG